VIKKTSRELYGFNRPRIPVRAYGTTLATIVGPAKDSNDKDDVFSVEFFDQWGKTYLRDTWGRHLSELRDDVVVLLFDTETTGLPKAWNKHSTDFENWPNIVEISATAIRLRSGDPFPEAVGSLSSIIRPNGFEIPEAASKIHGITTEKALDEGRPIVEVLKEFEELALDSDVLSAHNLDFDLKVTEAAFYREGMTPNISSMLPICTMKTTTKLVALPKSKWPKLSELHSHLFGFEFEGAHRSGADTEALVSCFVELFARDHFKTQFFKKGA